MTLILSLFLKEFAFRPREKWFHVKRLLYVVVGGLVILACFCLQWKAGSNKAGLVMFEWLSYLATLTAFLVAPYMSAAAIVTEKERGTFNLLLLSDISIGQLLVSKLVSSVCATGLTIFSVIPLFILCVSLGGININQILMAFPVLATTIFLGACLGLLLSCFMEQEMRMQGRIALGAVIFFGVLPILVYITLLLAKVEPEKTMTVISPFYAVRALKQARDFNLVGWSCLYNLALCPPLLILATVLLPILHRRPGGVNSIVLQWRKRLGLAPNYIQTRKRPQITGNPITWKDLHVHYGGERGAWKKACLGCGAIAFVVGATYITVASVPDVKVEFRLNHLFWWVLLFVALVCGINYLYGTLSRAAQCCSREKQLRTLDILLTTDISGYSIVTGKSNAISLALLPWIVGFACSSIGFLFFTLFLPDGFRYVMIAAAVMLNLVCMVFAYEYIAIYISMRAEKYATAAALSGFMAWYVVGNLVLFLGAAILAPFTFWLSLIALPVAGPIIVGNYFRRRLINEFSKIAIQGVQPKEVS